MGKRSLDKAKQKKDDEFYTKIEDIERELKFYKNYFKDKIIFANCDDPDWSNFYKYFELNFKRLGIKKLITTHFSKVRASYKLELELKNENLVKKQIDLETNGDFRSPECIEILKESDIVITNPPFSLFREYIAQLIEYKKKFLIIGSMNAISYREIFPLIKENKIWAGCNNVKEFISFNEEGKQILKKFGNVHWYTNLPHKKRNDEIFLYEKYNKKTHPKYDNFDAINVDKVTEIPKDYFGVMGVPISFIYKYNPSQFEIIDAIGRYSMLNGPTKETKGKYLTMINGSPKYARILIKRRKDDNKA